ncbi:MAG: sulfate adenylyltransferase subunit CysN, partial [Muribaculaceae bacterium]|nr:sulfate adenylyltransferase subunit CysN [Muribaculaceae bacterium]
RIDQIRYKVDVNTMEKSDCKALSLNEIGKAVFVTNEPIFFDPYTKNKNCGSFIIIDPITNNTSAVGMIIGEVDEKELTSTITEEDKITMRAGNSLVSVTERKKITGVDGKVYVVNGEKNDCINEFTYTLERRLFDIGAMPIVINAEEIDNKENVMTIAKKIAQQGYSVIVVNGLVDNDTIVCNAKEGNIAEDVKSLI